MSKKALTILRLSMAVTFIWISIMIFQEPLFWGGFIQPWAANLLPGPLEQVMISTAVMELIIGVAMLFNIYTWIAALIASLHLLVILITVGIDSITVRDIGLLGASVALFLSTVPKHITDKLCRKNKS